MGWLPAVTGGGELNTQQHHTSSSPIFNPSPVELTSNGPGTKEKEEKEEREEGTLSPPRYRLNRRRRPTAAPVYVRRGDGDAAFSASCQRGKRGKHGQ